MAYRDFESVKAVEQAFGLRGLQSALFAGAPPVQPPAWLRDQLARGSRVPMLTEKARGELIVMPVLLAAREQAQDTVTIYSGIRMDADPTRGLTGECDFIMGCTPPFPELRAPFMAMVEAKRDNIEAGLGQCAAQMVGAAVFNEKEGYPLRDVIGCVTNGEIWQFLRLSGQTITLDNGRYYLNELDRILGVFRAIFAEPPATSGVAA